MTRITPLGDALRNVEILYVDNDSQRRDEMRRLLMSLGAPRVHVAENAAEALKVVLGTNCGVVLVERDIPFVRQLRAEENHPRALIPALVLGEAASAELVKAALAAGANHFLVRPISPAKLYERIQWALADNRPFVLHDGHYVIRPTKKAPESGAALATGGAR